MIAISPNMPYYQLLLTRPTVVFEKVPERFKDYNHAAIQIRSAIPRTYWEFCEIEPSGFAFDRVNKEYLYTFSVCTIGIFCCVADALFKKVKLPRANTRQSHASGNNGRDERGLGQYVAVLNNPAVRSDGAVVSLRSPGGKGRSLDQRLSVASRILSAILADPKSIDPPKSYARDEIKPLFGCSHETYAKANRIALDMYDTLK